MDERHRVLHVTTTGRVGGAERLIADLAVAAQSGNLHAVAVAILSEPGDLGAELGRSGIPCYSFPIRGMRDVPSVVLSLSRLMIREAFTAVHGHLVHGAFIGLVAARLARVPLRVMTIHYDRYIWRYGPPLPRLLHILSRRLADHVFAVSHAAQEALVRAEGLARSKVTVVHNGIDAERVRRSVHFGIPLVGRAIVTVGSLEPWKGHRFLIEAFAQLRSTDGLPLVLIGDGHLRGRLADLARSLGVGGTVNFAGYRPNPYGLMNAAEFYVQPSLDEGFGLAVLESMALGKAVIATRVGGLPDIISDSAHGILVPPGDPMALRAAMESLLADHALRNELGTAGRTRVETAFSATAAARRYADEYDRLARTGAARPSRGRN
ncbi:MAG TPA: glycosyltransferase [Vicinamibacterales bacterium]|nr:glycosyltransferase [Vicinamibacterales bacterium]